MGTNIDLHDFTAFLFYYWWGGTKSLGTAATSGLLYKPQMTEEGDCGAIGGMKIGRGNRSTRRKLAPAPLCPPQIPYDQIRLELLYSSAEWQNASLASEPVWGHWWQSKKNSASLENQTQVN
jgi:hypothetical protein